MDEIGSVGTQIRVFHNPAFEDMVFAISLIQRIDGVPFIEAPLPGCRSRRNDRE
jgi:hypothetical protein